MYDRDTLYREIWKAPVTEVAKRYKVSDVAIHKVCKALDIPKSPQGYWAKLRAGKPVTVIPLPKNDKLKQKTGIQTGIIYQPEVAKETLAFLSEEERSIVVTVASQIMLPDENTRMHSKIISHRKIVAEWKKQQKNDNSKTWNRRNSDSVPFLAQSIAGDTIPRACRIIDALTRAKPIGMIQSLQKMMTFSEKEIILNQRTRRNFNIQAIGINPLFRRVSVQHLSRNTNRANFSINRKVSSVCIYLLYYCF